MLLIAAFFSAVTALTFSLKPSWNETLRQNISGFKTEHNTRHEVTQGLPLLHLRRRLFTGVGCKRCTMEMNGLPKYMYEISKYALCSCQGEERICASGLELKVLCCVAVKIWLLKGNVEVWKKKAIHEVFPAAKTSKSGDQREEYCALNAVVLVTLFLSPN